MSSERAEPSKVTVEVLRSVKEGTEGICGRCAIGAVRVDPLDQDIELDRTAEATCICIRERLSKLSSV